MSVRPRWSRPANYAPPPVARTADEQSYTPAVTLPVILYTGRPRPGLRRGEEGVDGGARGEQRGVGPRLAVQRRGARDPEAPAEPEELLALRGGGVKSKCSQIVVYSYSGSRVV